MQSVRTRYTPRTDTDDPYHRSFYVGTFATTRLLEHLSIDSIIEEGLATPSLINKLYGTKYKWPTNFHVSSVF